MDNKNIIIETPVVITSGELIALLGIPKSGNSELLSDLSRKETKINLSLNNKPISDISTVSYFSEDSCLLEKPDQIVVKCFLKKSFFKFSGKSKELAETFLRELPDYHTGLENDLNVPLKNLPLSRRLALTLLIKAFPKPDLLLADITSPLFTHSSEIPGIIRQLHKHHHQTCLIATSSPQQAFHLADRILVVRHRKIIHEINNIDKNEDTLAELWNEIFDDTSQTPDIIKLLAEQYI